MFEAVDLAPGSAPGGRYAVRDRVHPVLSAIRSDGISGLFSFFSFQARYLFAMLLFPDTFFLFRDRARHDIPLLSLFPPARQFPLELFSSCPHLLPGLLTFKPVLLQGEHDINAALQPVHVTFHEHLIRGNGIKRQEPRQSFLRPGDLL